MMKREMMIWLGAALLLLAAGCKSAADVADELRAQLGTKGVPDCVGALGEGRPKDGRMVGDVLPCGAERPGRNPQRMAQVSGTDVEIKAHVVAGLIVDGKADWEGKGETALVYLIHEHMSGGEGREEIACGEEFLGSYTEEKLTGAIRMRTGVIWNTQDATAKREERFATTRQLGCTYANHGKPLTCRR